MSTQFLPSIADSVAVFSTSLFTPEAYLDPGSGSCILQMPIDSLFVRVAPGIV